MLYTAQCEADYCVWKRVTTPAQQQRCHALFWYRGITLTSKRCMYAISQVCLFSLV